VQLVGRRMHTDALIRLALTCEGHIGGTAPKYEE
jgi:hypothetical protein